ncbi:MAG: ATP-binding protein [Bacteroidia bacterium]
MLNNKKFVFTGPPCSGKSSVFEKMKELFPQWQFVEEVARQELKFLREFEPHKLPWDDREFFQKYVETLQLKNIVNNEQNKNFSVPCIYDRSMIDEIAYRQFFGMEPSDYSSSNCKKYRYNKIFYFPLWEEIYKIDSERVEPLEEAKKIDSLLIKSYQDLEYQLTTVPKITVKERIDFIIQHIQDEYK